MSSNIKYLSMRDLLRIRDQVERDAQERFPVLNLNGLQSALATPRQAMFGEELFPTLCAKAGALVTLLIKNHPFWDANKRIASRALHEFLQRNNCRLKAPEDELVRFLLSIASGRLDASAAGEWIASHAASVPSA